MKKFWWILLGMIAANANAVDPTQGPLQTDPGLCSYGYNPNCGGRSDGYGSDSSTGSHIVIHIPPKFGALAHDPIASTTGHSYNADTKEQAIEWALESCRAGGKNKHCKILTWVKNGCIAAAVGRDRKKGGGRVFVATELPGEAEPKALERCRKHPDVTDCHIGFKEVCSLS